jgi:hypothetical protein
LSSGKNEVLTRILIRGSVDGFSKTPSWEIIHKKSPLLILVLSECNMIFGGCTSIPFPNDDDYTDEKAFIFSLTHGTKHL